MVGCMIHSEQKTWEKKQRSQAMQTMREYLLKYKETGDRFWYERAQWWGQQSKLWKERITTFDYSWFDENRRRVIKIIQRHETYRR